MTQARCRALGAVAAFTVVLLGLAGLSPTAAAAEADPVPQELNNSVTSPEGGCAEGSTDPDCTTRVGIERMKIVKTVDRTSAKPGEKVTYTLTVTNTGTVALSDRTVTDDLSKVVDDAAYNNDAIASAGAVSFAKPTLKWTGDLPVAGEVTITYSVTVNDPPKGDLKLANTVTGPRGSNCAKGSVDPACSPPPVLIPLLKIVKKGEPKAPRPGDTVRYTITVTNAGTAAYEDADLVDDLTRVLDDGAYNGDAEATGGEVRYAEPNLTWTGDVPLDGKVTITYSVTIDDPDLGDGRLDNAVVSNGPGTNCPPGSTDPDCDEHLPAPRYDWGDAPRSYPTLRKDGGAHAEIVPDLRIGASVDAETDGDHHHRAEGDQGDDGTATLPDLYVGRPSHRVTGLKMHNATGQDAVLAGWIDFDRDLAFDADELARVTVPAGDSETDLNWTGITYGTPGETFLRLRLYGVSRSETPLRRADFDVRPGGFGGPGEVEDHRMEILPAEMKITKKVDDTDPEPGDKLTYTVKVTSTSPYEFAGSFTDNLAKVLDDASYNGDATATTGAVAYSKPHLTWKGTVPAGGEVSVTYSVTVDDPAKGDGVLANAVVAENSNCVKGSDDPACRTRTQLPPPPDEPGDQGPETVVRQELPFTGLPAKLVLGLAGLLLLLGTACRVLGTERRRYGS